MEYVEKINVRPDKDRLINLLDDIKKGKLVVPKFQRDFVWSIKQRLELFDSISKGFPIGSLLFWNPEHDDFGYNNNIGPYKLDLNTKKYSYIIDGFQRITTLFSALTNPKKINKDNIDENIINDYIIYYNLDDEEFFHARKNNNNYITTESIPLYILVDTFEFLSFTKRIQENFDENLSDLFINRAKRLATSLLDYEIAFVNIHGGSIQDAVEIFSRINSKGSDMSPMWMISALTYEEGEFGFKFSDEIDNLKHELDEYNFGELKTEIILQCIESATGKIYFDVKTEALPRRDDFKSLSLETFINIKKAVNFLYEKVNVVNLSLLPYNLQLIFITEFFRLVKNPTAESFKKLEKWFWQTTYSSYFSIYSLSKQRKAYKRFQEFCRDINIDPLYKVENEMFNVVDFPNKIYYGSVRSKALALFLIKTVLDDPSIELKNKDLDDFYSLDKTDKDACLVFPKFRELSYRPRFDDFNRRKKDYTFILKGNIKNFNYSANFLNDYIIDDRVNLKKNRGRLISEKEADFVEKLGINYIFPSRFLQF